MRNLKLKDKIPQTKEIMFLRYGTEEPCKIKPPAPLLTLAFVAKLIKLPVNRVAYLSNMYFKGD